jgi:NADH-quinone oxidoreductase subunit K
MMQTTYPLVFAALLFSVGVYGVLSRRNAVLVLMSVEMMLASATINLVTLGQVAAERLGDAVHTGQVFALFIIAIAAAEVGVGLAIVLLLFRNRASINIDDADLMKY